MARQRIAAVDWLGDEILPLLRLRSGRSARTLRIVGSTTMALEGLEATPGEHMLVADDAESFADAVERLLPAESLRVRVGRPARERVLGLYSVPILHQHLLDAYTRVLDSSAKE